MKKKYIYIIKKIIKNCLIWGTTNKSLAKWFQNLTLDTNENILRRIIKFLMATEPSKSLLF